MEINSHIIKFTGTAELPEALLFEHNYDIMVKGEVRGADPRPNDDGTSNVIYPVRMLSAEIVKDDGTTIKTKDKKKISQKLRWAITFYVNDNLPDDPEDFYQSFVGWIIQNIDKLIGYYLKQNGLPRQTKS